MSAPYILRRDGHDYQAPDLDTLRVWAQAGRVLPGDMVYSPVYQSWYRASDLRGLRDVLPSPDAGAPPVVVQPVAQCFWLRKGEQNYSAESLEVILQWAADGIIDPEDYIFHPSYGKWFQAGDSPQLTSRFPPHIKHSPPFLPASADPMALAEVLAPFEPVSGVQAAPSARAAAAEPATSAIGAAPKAEPARSLESADSMAQTVMDMQAIRVDMLRLAAAKPVTSPRPVAGEGIPIDLAETGDFGVVTAEQAAERASKPVAATTVGPTRDGSSGWQHPAGGLFGGQREAVPAHRGGEPEPSPSGRASGAAGAPGAAVIRKSGAHALVDAAAPREPDRARQEAERLDAERRRQATERLEADRRRAEAERLEAERRRIEAGREASRHSAPIPVSRVAQPIEPQPSVAHTPTGGPGMVTLSGEPRPVTAPIGLTVPGDGGRPRTPTAPMSGESLGRPEPAPAVPSTPSPISPGATPIGMARPGALSRLMPTMPPTTEGPVASARPSERRATPPAEQPSAGPHPLSEPIAPGEAPMSVFGERPSTSPGGVPRSKTEASPVTEQGPLVQANTPVARPSGIISSRAGALSAGMRVVRLDAADQPTAATVPGSTADTSGTPRPVGPLAPRPAGGAKPPPLPAAVLEDKRPTPVPPDSPPAADVVPETAPVAAPSAEPASVPEVKFHDRLGLMKLFYDVAKVFVYTRDLRPGELLESSCTLGQGGEDFLGTAKRGIYHRLTAALEQHIEGPIRAARPEMSADEAPGFELMLLRAQQLLEVMRRAEPVIGQKPPERFVVGNTGRPKMSPEEESLVVEIDTFLKRLISTRAKGAGRAT